MAWFNREMWTRDPLLVRRVAVNRSGGLSKMPKKQKVRNTSYKDRGGRKQDSEIEKGNWYIAFARLEVLKGSVGGVKAADPENTFIIAADSVPGQTPCKRKSR